MQSNSPPSPAPACRPRLLVVELWGLGDLALAVPFLRAASTRAHVSLLAKPHAEPLVRRFCPGVELIPFTAPWTAFRGKYRLAHWPWADIAAVVTTLRRRRFAAAVSGRLDPRDHALLALVGARLRAGFPRAGSAAFLTDRLASPARPHRADHWAALATHFGWPLPPPLNRPATRILRHIVIHRGAGHPVRQWPAEHYAALAGRLRDEGWRVTVLDDPSGDLDSLLDLLGTADRFIGNDSGPGHLAALLGVPTFTIFGPQLPELFAPANPQSAWIDGLPCEYKPCFDACRFPTPHCIRGLAIDPVASAVKAWLAR